MMYFSLKIYTPIRLHIFFPKFSKTLKSEVLKFEKGKTKPGYI
jgi:hypothetical protein